MADSSSTQRKKVGWASLMASLIAVGAYLAIPVGPVPISMQTFFVMLAGFVLGSAYGALAVAIYLAAGCLGLPVFAGGTSGVAKLVGPTGGFLLGFVLLAAISGVAMRDRSQPLTWLRGLGWGALATVVALALGVQWLKIALDFGWHEALDKGVWPFLPGAVFKLVLCVATCRFLQRRGGPLA